MNRTPAQRAWQKIDIREPDECWPWLGAKTTDGYGHILANGCTTTTHRVIYADHYGEVPAGMEIDHTCRRRDCENPMHMEAVTHAENVRRARLLDGAY